MENTAIALEASLQTGFINASNNSLVTYRPSLLINEQPNLKILNTLLDQLSTCITFDFSVAFITSGGLATILSKLIELKENGIKGRIITSDYLTFTEPSALQTLYEHFPNIQLRFYHGNFHAKGYIFTHTDYSSIIIGSANLTQSALTTTKEWNLKLSALHEGELQQTVRTQFETIWEQASEVSPALIEHYKKIYTSNKTTRFSKSFQQGVDLYFETNTLSPNNNHLGEDSNEINIATINPNSMQAEALTSIQELRDKGEKKALLISATGTGKTYLCAFDVKQFQPRRFLFIVHRENIANAALKSFKDLFPHIQSGILGAGKRDHYKPYVFSMIQTLAKDEMLYSFDPEEFDYIVVDEAHRSGSDSYQKVLKYFNPKFLLGMTATPERTDCKDIYKLFDYNIAYEIRLNQALKENLLCPFHYFGVSDLTLDGVQIDDKSQLQLLVSPERVKLLDEAIQLYGMHSERNRGLIFCSRLEEAKELSQQMNFLGYRTQALQGSDSEALRINAVERLGIDTGDYLEYIISVDIFNEGIDIPYLNQIIMMRPTQSAIVFVQQLGRGLRKHMGKEYLTVIDFIGNYQNNYLIPVALYGDNTYSKDTMRKLICGGSRGIYGESTISFDVISMNRIFKSINKAKTDGLIFLTQEYQRVRVKVGRIPKLMDFNHLNTVNPQLFIKAKGSFYSFKLAIKERVPVLTLHQQKSLLGLSRIIASGIHPYEALVLKHFLMDPAPLPLETIQNRVLELYGYKPNEHTLLTALSLLQNHFFNTATRSKYGDITYINIKEREISPTSDLTELLSSTEYREEIADLIAFGLHEFTLKQLAHRLPEGFVLYRTYSRQDIFRLLGWNYDATGTSFGYAYDKISNTCPIFVTYYKDSEKISKTIDYKDKFASPSILGWESRTRRTLDSEEIKRIIQHEKSKTYIPLFIKKWSEDTDYYYMGSLHYISSRQSNKLDDLGNKKAVVEMQFSLSPPVENSLYEYLNNIGDVPE